MQPPAGPRFIRAAIDVGTNSVKLLIAEIRGVEVRPLLETSQQTRLGRGFYRNHELGRDAIAETARVVAEFRAEAEAHGATDVRAVATSAARDAGNRAELTEAVRNASGLTLEVISGAVEADWVYRGVITDRNLRGRPLLILDVGGGSTEFVVGHGDGIEFRDSFPLGTVRLLERFPPSDPPAETDWADCHRWLRAFMERDVSPMVRPFLSHRDRTRLIFVGTGGTTAILARIQLGLTEYVRDRIDGCPLTFSQILAARERLWRLALAERREIRGLPSDRADVILMGAAIYQVVMEVFEFASVTVSLRGLRFAALFREVPDRGAG